ncbi:MAG: hypothetical protein QHH14_02425 [Clostridiales bacterium]|nr:hypothetical protein [Clostridiales bacterium]
MEKKGVSSLWVLACLFFSLAGVSSDQPGSSPLQALLPRVEGWELVELPQRYFPDTLFEYIDGAAESYLSYDFRELMVAQYKLVDSPASLTLEIYDLGSAKNAFGIYSVERYPESRFLSIGAQGYHEEGTLNFVIGAKYVKLLCFDCGEEARQRLELFAREVENQAKEKGGLPEALKYFPKEGLVANSEKFILRNFLGFSFLHNGYLASYQNKGAEFELFLVEAESDAEAENMLKQYLASLTKGDQVPDKVGLVFHIRDRYASHVYVTRVQKYILGVMRIKDGFEEMGQEYLKAFKQALAH